MARSEITTWLSIDEWGSMMGLNPLALNQLHSSTLFPNNQCGDMFFQNAFLHSDRVGRDEIAEAIREAELEISKEVGYNLIPDWTIDERMNYPRPAAPGMFGNALNPRGLLKSIELPRGYVQSGGVRTKSALQLGAAVVRTDNDGDGYQETATVTVATTVTSKDEIRVYYPAKDASDGWEVRPIKVSFSGGNAVITFKVWLISAAQAQEALDAQPLDANIAASYETTVDVYRVYNNPATQVKFLWENDSNEYCCSTCAACQFGTQDGCFHSRDQRLGIVVLAPATWVPATSSFTSIDFSACREPDQVRLWYYSGFMDNSLERPYVEMSRHWKPAVAYYAASKLDRDVCGCSNVAEFINKWRRDAMFSSEDLGAITTTPEFASNALGTSIGALFAYRRIHQNGVRINK